MKAIGIRELKARLSQVLREVRAGETVLVTDRAQVVAELWPAGRGARSANPRDAALDDLDRKGELRRSLVAKADWTWQVRGAGMSAVEAESLLSEVRAERDL